MSEKIRTILGTNTVLSLPLVLILISGIVWLVNLNYQINNRMDRLEEGMRILVKAVAPEEIKELILLNN